MNNNNQIECDLFFIHYYNSVHYILPFDLNGKVFNLLFHSVTTIAIQSK